MEKEKEKYYVAVVCDNYTKETGQPLVIVRKTQKEAEKALLSWIEETYWEEMKAGTDYKRVPRLPFTSIEQLSSFLDKNDAWNGITVMIVQEANLWEG